jgi:hypothetical protein
MADRILTMEERIGMMADRIVRTEELMAKLTATLADKDLSISSGTPRGGGIPRPPVLSIPTTRLSADSTPELEVSGDPAAYVLYVSTDPLFREGATVISNIRDADDFPASWRRSIGAIKGPQAHDSKGTDEPLAVSVAVRTVSDSQDVSPLSNSIDLTLHIR